MLLKWYTFIKPTVILDALCGMDPEVVGFESTESSDKNLPWNILLMQKEIVSVVH